MQSLKLWHWSCTPSKNQFGKIKLKLTISRHISTTELQLSTILRECRLQTHTLFIYTEKETEPHCVQNRAHSDEIVKLTHFFDGR